MAPWAVAPSAVADTSSTTHAHRPLRRAAPRKRGPRLSSFWTRLISALLAVKGDISRPPTSPGMLAQRPHADKKERRQCDAAGRAPRPFGGGCLRAEPVAAAVAAAAVAAAVASAAVAAAVASPFASAHAVAAQVDVAVL